MSSDVIEQTGILESAARIPLTEALARWRFEAAVGDCPAGRFYVWGRGQPLVLLHGLSDCARSFVPVMAHLTNEFRCIAFELPSHGDLRSHAIGIGRLLDHLGCRQASLYGASFGGLVAIQALAVEPRRYLRAALQGAFAHRRMTWAEKLVIRLARYAPAKLGDVRLWRALQRRADAEAFSQVSPDLWEFQRVNTGATPIKTFAHRASLVASTDLRPLLPTITHPILLLNGDRDGVVSRASMQELAAGLPHADQLEFSSCGHYAQYTHAPAVAAAIKRFLKPPCGL